FEPTEALAQMLRGTSLTFEVDGHDHSVLIKQRQEIGATAVVLANHAEPEEFKIGSGPAFITQSKSKLDLIFDGDEVGSLRTRTVSGRLEPLDALRRTLRGSGCTLCPHRG